MASVFRLGRPHLVLWLAWVAAGMLANMLTVLAFLRSFGVPIGYPPGQIGSEVTTVLVGSAGGALLEYVVFRVVIGTASRAAVAWVPVTIFVGLADYLALYFWLSSPYGPAAANIQTSTMLFQFPLALLAGVAQGIVLAKIFHLRLAIALWPAAGLIALAVGELVFSAGPLLRALGGLPLLAGVLAGDALGGGINGAVTGVALVVLARRSARFAAPPAF